MNTSRIQHNIAAMNSYRNFSANNTQLSKNLEKLSSGYKINRAGDDAAGLAISEKMRAQITGLTGAKKNATDGISLIQTAEGALTEVHDMLNRMVTLTEQSANGTYDNDVDRAQLQKEVESLKSEINRIADSTNFNGLKLLDGSLAVSGVDANLSSNIDATKTLETANTYRTSAALVTGTGSKAAEGDKLSYTVAWQAEDGSQYSKTVNLTLKKGSTLNAELGSTDYADDNGYLQADDGTIYSPQTTVDLSANTGTIAIADVEKALTSELNKDENLAASFDIKFESSGDTNRQYTANTIAFTAKTAGTGGAKITAQAMSQKTAAGAATTSFFASGAVQTYDTYEGKDAEQKLDLSRVAVLKGASTTVGGYNSDTLKKAVFEVEGKKFVMVGKDATGEGLQNLDQALSKAGYDDVTVIHLAAAGTITGADGNAPTLYGAGDVTNNTTVATALSRATGETFEASNATSAAVYGGAAAATNVDGNGFQADAAADTTNGNIYYKGSTQLSNISTLKDGKLTLQIGDTSDDFNKLSMNVSDMHTKAMGIDDVDISTQEGAAEAMDKIKAAVNYVSDVRGGLGALQNRLDHTINNLGVMTENIQTAESAIRDTDVAEEMMTYTKNNILNQSAQAMLAQANQLPQGVLQLLG